MKLPLINIDSTKNSSIEISDKLVKLKINHKLIKFVIDWQLNHAKPRTAKTKQRNQIQGSTKKIIAQKGSGGARHASKKAPIFVVGGVAHGPKGSVYKVKKINKKVRRLALAQTLSKKNNEKNLFFKLSLFIFNSFGTFNPRSYNRIWWKIFRGYWINHGKKQNWYRK